MNSWFDVTLDGIARHPGALKLGSTLLHFVWQGAAWGAVALLVMSVSRRTEPRVRYAFLLAVLGLMSATPIVTYAVLPTHGSTAELPAPRGPDRVTAEPTENHEQLPLAPVMVTVDVAEVGDNRESIIPALQPLPVSSDAPDPAVSTATAMRDRGRELLQRFHEFRHWIVAGWIIGVGLLSLRLLAGLVGAELARRHGVIAIADQIQHAVDRLALRLGIHRRVLVVESPHVEVPMLTGWLRPVILLPASALCGLYPEQLEAIVAHELAHVRRHDYLVNLLQTVVETLLFYHPAVWWVSRRIRQEREHCCDDLAIALCQDRVAYARALASMEELRDAARWVVAARGGSLVERISRLLGRQEPVPPGRPALLLVLIVVSFVLGTTWHLRSTLQAEDAELETASSGANSATPESENSVPEPRTAKTPPTAPQVVQNLTERIQLCLRPDPAVKTLSYDIILGGESTPIRVQRHEKRRIGVWQGTTLQGGLQQLLHNPDRFVAEIVAASDPAAEAIHLRITPRDGPKTFRIEAGNGVENSWRGYFSQGADETTLVIDAQRMLPVKERTGKTSIRYGDWKEVRPGKWFRFRSTSSKSRRITECTSTGSESPSGCCAVRNPFLETPCRQCRV